MSSQVPGGISTGGTGDSVATGVSAGDASSAGASIVGSVSLQVVPTNIEDELFSPSSSGAADFRETLSISTR